MSSFEIERKFLVKEIPAHLNSYKHTIMEQGYLSFSPTIRIRREGDIFVLTVKGSGSIKRVEIEHIISEELYRKLIKLVISKIIKKTRYYIPLQDGLIAELDIYLDYPSSLLTVEVEFMDMDSANSFVPPSWFSRDVTFDGRFSNAALSRLQSEEDIAKFLSTIDV